MITDQKYDGTVPLPGETRLNTMTAEQQIRAKALECAVRQEVGLQAIDRGSARDFWEAVGQFETYIREGK